MIAGEETRFQLGITRSMAPFTEMERMRGFWPRCTAIHTKVANTQLDEQSKSEAQKTELAGHKTVTL